MRRISFQFGRKRAGSAKGATGCQPESTAPCRCQSAVKRCYQGLCSGGQPEKHAFEAALTVYRWYHPEVPLTQAEATVRSWVCGGALH